ncbi:MAG: hypothetical protein HUJ56_05410, partial [Erysipelotrichaceae bacterium]|nr:hypothetical protein [Erysipelotrichaceae bacterium]
INRDSLIASLNRFEFNNKERGGSWAPEGIILGIISFDSWLYGGDPLMYLESAGVFEQLKAKVEEGYFEGLIQEVLDNLDKVALVVGLPSVTLTEEQNKAEEALAAKLKRQLSEDEITQLIEDNKVLVEWQQTPNSEEELSSIPQLKKEDVNPYPEEVNYEVEEKDGVVYLKHETTPSGISYLNLYFSLADYPVEDYSKLAFYTGCLGALPTKKYSAAELMTKTKMYLGSFSAALVSYTRKNELDTCAPYFVVSTSFLEENKEEALGLIKEILFNTNFNCPKELKDMLSQRYTSKQQQILARANAFAKTRILASYTAKGRLSEETSGYTYYRWLKKKNKYFDEDIEGLIEFFSNVKHHFTRSNLVVSSNGLTGLEEYVSDFEVGTKKETHVSFEFLPKENFGVEIPSGVSYAGLGGNYMRLGDSYDYGMRVLNKILTLEYLWIEVRVKNGAYGVSFSMDDEGNVIYTSFRDPDGNNSINAYRNSANFIREFESKVENVDRYMIGAISDIDGVLDNKSRVLLGDTCYLGEITYEERLEVRKGILNFKKDDLKKYADILDKVIEQNHVAIFGSKAMCEKEHIESVKL